MIGWLLDLRALILRLHRKCYITKYLTTTTTSSQGSNSIGNQNIASFNLREIARERIALTSVCLGSVGSERGLPKFHKTSDHHRKPIAHLVFLIPGGYTLRWLSTSY